MYETNRSLAPQLEEFLQILCGEFDNSQQLAQLEEYGVEGYPHARHVNTDCTGLITGLPQDFAGAFVLEESYYTQKGRTNPMPHLFLFTYEDGRVKLTSYEIPEGYTKETFQAANLSPIPASSLEVSEKFTPAWYQKEGDAWVGGSESWFTPVMKFTLWERFSPQVLEVTETIEVNGKRTFGYDLPLEYRRIKN